MNKEVELTVISPMYNEQGVIENSVKNLAQAIDSLGVSWELLLVNDGSTDGTLAIIEILAKDNDRIKVISYTRNRGRGYALRSGFNASCGRYVVTTESDLTWGKNIIRELYDELLASESDVVIASPYAPNGRLENVPFRRAMLSSLGNKILRMTVPANITMLSGMTRGYRGDFIRSLPLEEDRKEIHLEIVSKAVILGAAFSEVPAILRWEPPKKDAPVRKSKFKAKKLIVSHLLFSFHESPILLFGGLGGLLLVIGSLMGFHLAWDFLIQKETIGDRIVQIILTSFLILSGLSMFIYCFIAYQIKQLKAEVFKLACQQKAGRADN